MKKYICEFIGTLMLVLLGCGGAVLAGEGIGMVGIAFCFGLAIVAIAYSVGRISGGHVNPAVSLAMLINGKISLKDFAFYVIAQVLGAFAGAGILLGIVKSTNLDMGSLGSNGFGTSSAVGINVWGALIVEVIATAIFVLVILGVTHNDKHAGKAGIVIGLTLALIHMVCIPLTGTSVNPARSLAPAVLVGGDAFIQVWVFIVAPLVGAAIAGFGWKYLAKDEKEI